jgi:hypothetical protein
MQLLAIVVIRFLTVEAQHFMRELTKLVVARREVKPIHQQISETLGVRSRGRTGQGVRDCIRREALFRTPSDQRSGHSVSK